MHIYSIWWAWSPIHCQERQQSHSKSSAGAMTSEIGEFAGSSFDHSILKRDLGWTQKSLLGQSCCLNQQWCSKSQPPLSHDYDPHGSKHVGIWVTLSLFLTQGNTFQEPRPPEIGESFWIDFFGFSQTHSKKSTFTLEDFKDGLRIGSLSSFCNFC